MALTYMDNIGTLQTIPQPNLFTAIGTLCLDSTIRREFFHDVTPPVQDVFLYLEETDFQTCMKLAATNPPSPPEADYAAVGALYCRKQPCPHAVPNIETVIGAAVLDEGFRAAWLNNPHQAHLDYGFDLLEEEDAIVVDHVARHKKNIEPTVRVLGDQLKAIINIPPLATIPKVAMAKAKAA